MTKKTNISRLIPVWMFISGLSVSVNISAQQDTGKVLSQYLFPGFSNGTVKFKTGPARDAMMNYNTLSEKMVFEQGGKFFDVVSTETIDTVYLGNLKFIPSDKVFLEVVLSGKIPFFIQHRADLMSPGKQAGYGGTSQTTATTSITTLNTSSGTYNMKLPDDYTVKPSQVYWVLVNGSMGKFLNERQFLKILSDNQMEIKKFIKDNKIKFEKRDDLIRLITYCQGL
jgi:hypothetical protein